MCICKCKEGKKESKESGGTRFPPPPLSVNKTVRFKVKEGHFFGEGNASREGKKDNLA